MNIRLKTLLVGRSGAFSALLAWAAVAVGVAILVGGVAVLVGGAQAVMISKQGVGEKVEPGKPHKVVATVAMVADIVREVAGDRADVTGLIGTGVDPHLYRATRGDFAKMQAADIVFYSGLHLEGKMTDVLVKLARSKPVYPVTEAVAESRLLFAQDNVEDPHAWMDVSIWADAVTGVAKKLSEFDPASAEGYRARAAAFNARLNALHAYGKRVVGSIPAERRVLITSHDAFGYFGRAYGVEVRGIQGISTESEAGLRDINALVDLLVSRKVSAVFVESSVPRKNVEALIEGARRRGHEVRIGGELFSDAMGPSGTYEGTYEGMLDHNLTLVARALGGEAPEKGHSGKLTVEGDKASRAPGGGR